jgi:tetratricopeptide (TPR) repeat protein
MWESASQQLSPIEGFLLSRIDGQTPWAQLRQIAGIPPEEADRYLERWQSEGIVVMSDGALARPGSGEEGDSSDPQSDLRIDPELGIDVELQGRILDFESSLDRSYFELLSVSRDTEAKEIKRAYFTLSKVFHPDRYFRKELGHFKERLEKIFRKLVEAYELLSDPMTRAELERSLGPAPPPEPQPCESAPTKSNRPSPQKLTKREILDRLSGHFKVPQSILAERRQKASHFYDVAMAAAEQEHWSEAAPNLRLAIAFDPWNSEYSRHFVGVLSHYHEQRAVEMIEAGNDTGAVEDRAEALRLLEEALIHRPADPDLNERAAKLAMTTRELDRATEYAEAACELDPETAGRRITLARVLRRAGERDRAIEVLNEAACLDPDDGEIQDELKDLRPSRRSTT